MTRAAASLATESGLRSTAALSASGTTLTAAALTAEASSRATSALTAIVRGARPVFADAGAVTHSATLEGTHSLAAPDDVSAGDFLLYVAQARNNNADAAVTTAPDGFTAFDGIPFQDALVRLRTFLYWKEADGTEGGETFPITLTGGSTTDNFTGFIARFTAANGFAAVPFDGVTSAEYGGTTLTPGPSLVPSGLRERGVSIVAVTNNRALTTWEDATGGTWETHIAARNSLGGGNLTVQMQTVAFDGTDDVSGGTITVSSGVIGIAVSFRLIPADTSLSIDDRTQGFLEREAFMRARNENWGTFGQDVSVSVEASADDANEVITSGSVNIVGTTIGFQDDRIAAFRFRPGLAQGSDISNVRIQFTASFTNFPPDNSQAGEITIWCEDADDAEDFTAGITADITGRTLTSQSVVWTMPESAGSNLWTAGERTAAQQTPDLSAILQPVVDRASFDPSSAVVFIFKKTSTGDSMVRQVAAFDHATYDPPTLTLHTLGAVFDPDDFDPDAFA